MFTAIVFVATLALLVLGYALYSSLTNASNRLSANRLANETKRAANSGAMIGAGDKLGK